jgi:hypothetical protein
MRSGRNAGVHESTAKAGSVGAAQRKISPAPILLTGPAELRVVGVTFRPQAIMRAHRATGANGVTDARLIPDRANEHDPFAVKVIIAGQHVGWLSRHISPVIQPALDAFSAANDSRTVSCLARFADGTLGMRITLHLDLASLGLNSSDVDDLPELDQVIMNLLPRLDTVVPPLMGCDEAARRALSVAEADRTAVDEDRDRNPRDWPRVEKAFRAAAARLETAGDPMVSDAWLGVALSTRWQRGRGEDMLAAAVEALHWNIANADAWHELIARAAAAPHVGTLVSLFARVPREVRRPVVSQLLAISRGRDRMRRMTEMAGRQLREELLGLARSQGDEVTARKLIKAL